MARFWSKIKDACFTEESQQRTKRKSPRMASLALEVLENREEAQDVVYYDALKRINADPMVGCFLSGDFICGKKTDCNRSFPIFHFPLVSVLRLPTTVIMF